MALDYSMNSSIPNGKYGLLGMLSALATQGLPCCPRGFSPGQANPALGFCHGMLTVMVGLPTDDGEGSVDLFYRYKPHHLMVKGERRERN